MALWGSDVSFPPVVGFVDLAHPEADRAIGSVVEPMKVVTYGPHVDGIAFDPARLLGVVTVLPRSKMFKAVLEYLPRVT